MRLFPTDDVSRFQLFALLFLVSILASTFIGAAAFAATLVLFGTVCFFLSRPLARPQRNQAYALFCVFGLFGLGALFGSQLMTSPGQALGIMPFLVAGFAALYAAVKLYVVSWDVECKVIGYSGGFAIVEVAPSVLAAVAPGIHVVKSGPVTKGRKARLVFERKLFGSASKPARLETRA
jgi:hypothetical protein